MRGAAAVIFYTALYYGRASAQFQANVPLVIAPTTITDSKGQYVNGLTPEDVILYDSNVPQPMQMDWTAYPISLVVVVQTSSNSGAVIDKLGASGILFTQLLAADAGETAVISFSDNVKVRQTFSNDTDSVTRSLRMLRMEGDGAHILDAMHQALTMLSDRPGNRRRIVLMIAEKRDRSSKAKLTEVMEETQRLNAIIYWLSYSPFLAPFTAKPRTAEDLKPEAERAKAALCAVCPAPDDTGVPADIGPGGLMYGIAELMRLHQPDLSRLFAETTGGRSLFFLKKSALEQSIQLVAREVHTQYLFSFEPKSEKSGEFHSIKITVKDRTDVRVRAREGYWAVQ